MAEQYLVLLFSGTAILLVASKKSHVRRWGYISGVCSQPFYFYATFKAHQWGMFTLCFWYTFSWGLGAYNHWIRK